MNKINVICLYYGDAYSVEYVANLSKAVAKFLTVPYQFYIMTDHCDDAALQQIGTIIPLPKNNYKRAWWHKLYMFSAESGLTGTCLYFDLDIIVRGDLDCFVAQDLNLHIIHDFNRVNHMNVDLSNSSIVSWPHEKYRYLYEQFIIDPSKYVHTMHGDQDFIHKFAIDKQWYKIEWAVSYRWEYLTGRNYGPKCRAIVLHGKPKPHQLEDTKLLAQWHQLD